jgi:hypothetical protein
MLKSTFSLALILCCAQAVKLESQFGFSLPAAIPTSVPSTADLQKEAKAEADKEAAAAEK